MSLLHLTQERVVNSVELLLRAAVTRYYAGWLVCEDPGCSGRTRVMPLRFQTAYPVCPVCRVSSMYQVGTTYNFLHS